MSESESNPIIVSEPVHVPACTQESKIESKSKEKSKAKTKSKEKAFDPHAILCARCGDLPFSNKSSAIRHKVTCRKIFRMGCTVCDFRSFWAAKDHFNENRPGHLPTVLFSKEEEETIASQFSDPVRKLTIEEYFALKPPKNDARGYKRRTGDSNTNSAATPKKNFNNEKRAVKSNKGKLAVKTNKKKEPSIETNANTSCSSTTECSSSDEKSFGSNSPMDCSTVVNNVTVINVAEVKENKADFDLRCEEELVDQLVSITPPAVSPVISAMSEPMQLEESAKPINKSKRQSGTLARLGIKRRVGKTGFSKKKKMKA